MHSTMILDQVSTGDQDKHLQKPVERENIYVAVRNMKDCDIKPPEKIDQTTVAHYMDPPLPSLPVSEPQGLSDPVAQSLNEEIDIDLYRAPIQEGPLAQYPSFSVVDEAQKWQRIQEWALFDSVAAANNNSCTMLGTHGSDLNVKVISPPVKLDEHALTNSQVTSFEARALAAEGQLSLVEQRNALESDSFKLRIIALEEALEGEKMLVARAQEQLHAEHLHTKSLIASEAVARESELAVERKLDRVTKALDLEKRRGSEALALAQSSIKEYAEKLSALGIAKNTVEDQLRKAREINSSLSRKLDTFKKQEQELKDTIQELQSDKRRQEHLLSSTSTQVDRLRAELQALGSRQTSRDEKLLKHVEEFEAHEIAALRSDLDEDRMKLDKYCEEYDILRDAFISMHDLLSPQYAAFLFEACNSPLQAHASFDGGLHAAISERIASQGFISSCDATSLSDRLKILFDHFGAVLLNFERRESASKVEFDGVREALASQIQHMEGQYNHMGQDHICKEARLNSALAMTTARVNDLMAELDLVKRAASQSDDIVHRLNSQLEHNNTNRCNLERQVAELQNQLVQISNESKHFQSCMDTTETENHHLKETIKVKDERINELRIALGRSQASLEQEGLQLAALTANRDLTENQAQLAVTKAQSDAAMAKEEARLTIQTMSDEIMHLQTRLDAAMSSSEAWEGRYNQIYSNIKNSSLKMVSELQLLLASLSSLKMTELQDIVSDFIKGTKEACNQASEMDSGSLASQPDLMSSCLSQLCTLFSSNLDALEVLHQRCYSSWDLIVSVTSRLDSNGLLPSKDQQTGFDRPKSAMEAMDAVLKTIDLLHSQMCDKEGYIVKLNMNAASLQHELDAITHQMTTNMSRLQGLHESNQQLELSLLENSKAFEEESSFCRDKIQSLENDLNATFSHISELENCNRQLNQGMLELNEVNEIKHKEFDGISLRLRDTERQCQELRLAVNTSTRKSSLLILRIRILRKKLSCLVKNNQNLSRRNRQLDTEAKAKDTTIKTTCAKRNQLMAELQSSKIKLSDLDLRSQKISGLVQKLEDRRIRLESENHKLALHGSSIQEQLNEKSKSMDLLSKKCEALSREHELTQKDLQLSEQSRIKSEQQAHCLLDKLEDAEVTLKEAVLMSTTLQKEYEVLHASFTSLSNNHMALQKIAASHVQLDALLVTKDQRISELRQALAKSIDERCILHQNSSPPVGASRSTSDNSPLSPPDHRIGILSEDPFATLQSLWGEISLLHDRREFNLLAQVDYCASVVLKNVGSDHESPSNVHQDDFNMLRDQLQQMERLVQSLTDKTIQLQSTSDLQSKDLIRKDGEIRELNQLLKAWEAMRMGKDAQIEALIEKGKRHEEDTIEKKRTIDALRRKLNSSI